MMTGNDNDHLVTSVEQLERIYRDAPGSRVYNLLIQQTVRTALEATPREWPPIYGVPGVGARIVECMAGGTGGHRPQAMTGSGCLASRH